MGLWNAMVITKRALQSPTTHTVAYTATVEKVPPVNFNLPSPDTHDDMKCGLSNLASGNSSWPSQFPEMQTLEPKDHCNHQQHTLSLTLQQWKKWCQSTLICPRLKLMMMFYIAYTNRHLATHLGHHSYMKCNGYNQKSIAITNNAHCHLHYNNGKNDTSQL